MAERCSLLVLAGGNSRRMGRDKASLPAGNVILVEHIAGRLAPTVDEVLISVAKPGTTFSVGRTVADQLPGLGPLGGMHAGFREARNPLVWVVACDLPDVEPSLGRLLQRSASGADAAVPKLGDRLEGLCAVYRPAVGGAIEALVGRGERSVRALLDTVGVHVLSEDELRRVDPELRSFRNLNTPSDYAEWLKAKRSS